MSKPETRTQTRVEVTKDGMRFRPRLVIHNQRKEPKTMNYREFNPKNPCLPPEVYPYLWATLLANPQPPKVGAWEKVSNLAKRFCAALPLLVGVACLPEPDLQPGPDSQIHSLVWVQPLPRKKLPQPPTLPRVDGNPWCL